MLLLLRRRLIGRGQVLLSRLLVGQARQRLAGPVLLVHPLAVVHLICCLLVGGIKVPQVEVILAPSAALVVIELHLPTVGGAGRFASPIRGVLFQHVPVHPPPVKAALLQYAWARMCRRRRRAGLPRRVGPGEGPYMSMALASDYLLALLGRLRTSSFESSDAFSPLRGERSLSFSSMPAARSGERASDCAAVGVT